MRVTRLRVLEEERFVLPATLDTPQVRERLLRISGSLPFEAVKLDRKGLRAGGVVGLLDAGRIQLEILPKASSSASSEENSQFLLDLLSYAGLVPHPATLAARIRVGERGALEHIVQALAEDLQKRLLEGMPRRYVVRSDELSVLRGRVDFGKLARQVPGRGAQIPCRNAPLHPDNALSQLVLGVLRHLGRLALSAQTLSRLRASEAMLSHVTDVPLTARLVDRARPTRLEGQWASVVDLAEALLAGRRPDPTSAGASSLFGLLFSLDDVFERVLRKALTECLRTECVQLIRRPRQLKLLYSEAGDYHALPLRPDFLFSTSSALAGKVLVGDAKWKCLDQGSPSFGLRATDVYQLATYMASHQLERGVLFFPRQDWMTPSSGLWHHDFRLIDGRSLVRLIGVDVPGLVTGNDKHCAQALEDLCRTVLEVVL